MTKLELRTNNKLKACLLAVYQTARGYDVHSLWHARMPVCPPPCFSILLRLNSPHIHPGHAKALSLHLDCERAIDDRLRRWRDYRKTATHFRTRGAAAPPRAPSQPSPAQQHSGAIIVRSKRCGHAYCVLPGRRWLPHPPRLHLVGIRPLGRHRQVEPRERRLLF